MTETKVSTETAEPETCAGVIAYDQLGNMTHRYACEVHLFTPGVCEWQKKTGPVVRGDA